jgi:hypothetical protein
MSTGLNLKLLRVWMDPRRLRQSSVPVARHFLALGLLAVLNINVRALDLQDVRRLLL